MPSKPSLSSEEFDALRPRLGRLSIDSLDVARAILVEGLRPTDVADRHGMSRQRVHGIVQRFLAVCNEVPTHWRRVEVWLPPELAEQVEALAEKARADHAVGGASAGKSAS